MKPLSNERQLKLAELPTPSPSKPQGKSSRSSLSSAVLSYFESLTRHSDWKNRMGAYTAHTSEFLSQVVPKNKRVLLIGCLSTEIIEALAPSYGVGLDANAEATRVARANSKNPKIQYHCGLPEDFETQERFDYVLLLNVVDHSHDIFSLVGSLQKFVHEDSRVILSTLNPLWHPLARLASRLRLRAPDYTRNLVASRVLASALEIKKFKVMDICRRVLLPRRVPLLSFFLNQFISRLPGINALCFMQYICAKPAELKHSKPLSCSVIIPCYNEEGNIAECIQRVPAMGIFTEIIVVNDGSKDRTLSIVESLRFQCPQITLITYEKNQGKGNAVMQGLRAAKGDIVIICDADMTVPPEELTEFFEALESKSADFANGTRFLYPMEREAMRLTNYVGNILFSKLVGMIIDAECSDTLCGTKAMRKADFDDLVMEDSAWGDFDFIFHAARRKLKCVQIPVHYKNRIAGESKMQSVSAGFTFLRLCLRQWAKLP